MASSVLVIGASGVMGTACKGGGDKASTKDGEKATKTPVVAKDDGSEKELLSRRDSLLKARARIRARRGELQTELKKVVAAGGSTTVVNQKISALQKDEKSLIDDQAQFIQKYDAHLNRLKGTIASLNTAPRSQGERLVAREGVLASREKSLASRETRVGAREAALAERERKVAKREQLECAVGGGTTTIVRTVDAKGSRYTRKDVDPLLRGARRLMSQRGILRSDLSGPARRLERQATKAMKKGDYGAARFAASTLVATVRATRINKMFIAAKMNRLSRYIKGKRLKSSTQSKVDGLFRDATRSYGDGRFTNANRRLNRIYGVIN